MKLRRFIVSSLRDSVRTRGGRRWHRRGAIHALHVSRLGTSELGVAPIEQRHFDFYFVPVLSLLARIALVGVADFQNVNEANRACKSEVGGERFCAAFRHLDVETALK